MISLQRNQLNITHLVLLAIFLLVYTFKTNAQCSAGIVTTAHSSSVYDAYLDPDGDGYITESGGTFTSDTTELPEFEILPNSVNDWIEITDVSETDKDLNPLCGNTDLVNDKNGGGFAYYNIVDPTPVTPTNGDEYIILRFRLPQDPNGNFGYNFLFDTDNKYGTSTDPNATCGNQGFEREIQFANAGGKKGVSAYNVDGSTSLTALSPPCSQCISVSDIQISCAKIAGDSIPGATPPDDDCNSSEPSFITFALELSHVGVASDIAPKDFYVVVATASSGNATSVLGGGNVVDMGAIDGDVAGCPSCVGLSGCALFDCQTDCVSSKFLADYTLPVDLSYFEVGQNDEYVDLHWTTQQEIDNDHFVIQRSRDGGNFEEIRRVLGKGNSNFTQYYHFKDQLEKAGTYYYRLKQVDVDEKFTFSVVKSVKFQTEEAISIFPTMVESEAVLQYESANSGITKVGVIDLSGCLVFSQSFEIEKGHNEKQLNLGNLPKGMYFVNIYNTITKQSHTIKLIKR